MTHAGESSCVRVSFVIVNYRVAAKVLEAVRSIEQHCDVPFEVVVVDNSESARELACLQARLSGRARVIDAKQNLGFGAGCNAGARRARGRYLFFLNPDARLLGPCVSTMLAHLEHHRVIGAIGAKLVYRDGDEGHSAGQFIGLRRPLQVLKGSLHAHRCYLVGRAPERGPKRKLAGGLSRVDWCSGAALMMRAADFARIGGFDERYFLYYEECDLQYRMQRQLGCVAAIDADVHIFHEDGGTGLDHAKKRALIEHGCLRFVSDHHPRSVYLLYKLMMLQVTFAEMTLSLLRRDRARARLHAQLFGDIACFHSLPSTMTHAFARGATASPKRQRHGDDTWHTETTSAVRHAVATQSLRRARVS